VSDHVSFLTSKGIFQKLTINLTQLSFTALSVFHFTVDDSKFKHFCLEKIQIIVDARILDKYGQKTRVLLGESLTFKSESVVTIRQFPYYSAQLLDEIKNKKILWELKETQGHTLCRTRF